MFDAWWAKIASAVASLGDPALSAFFARRKPELREMARTIYERKRAAVQSVDPAAWARSVVGAPWRKDRYSTGQLKKLYWAIRNGENPWGRRLQEAAQDLDAFLAEVHPKGAMLGRSGPTAYDFHEDFKGWAKRRLEYLAMDFDRWTAAAKGKVEKAHQTLAEIDERIRGRVAELDGWRDPVLWAASSTPEERIEALKRMDHPDSYMAYRYLRIWGLDAPIADPKYPARGAQSDLYDILRGKLTYLEAQAKYRQYNERSRVEDAKRWRNYLRGWRTLLGILEAHPSWRKAQRALGVRGATTEIYRTYRGTQLIVDKLAEGWRLIGPAIPSGDNDKEAAFEALTEYARAMAALDLNSPVHKRPVGNWKF